MTDIEFNVKIHFANGVTVDRQVPLAKAVKLAMKENVLIDTDSELYEIKGLNSSIVIPLNMTFVINTAPDFKHADKVSRYMLYKRDQGRCAYCGKDLTPKEATVDHILPRAQGGQTTWENVALACHRCNCRKDNKTPAQANMKLRVTPYNPKKVKQVY